MAPRGRKDGSSQNLKTLFFPGLKKCGPIGYALLCLVFLMAAKPLLPLEIALGAFGILFLKGVLSRRELKIVLVPILEAALKSLTK